MSDYVNIPVAAGTIRVKYDSAEWSPKGDKLILQAPIIWYPESDAQDTHTESEGVLMMDKMFITETLTNPVRFEGEWGERLSQNGKKLPDWVMRPPLPEWEEVTPTQSQGRSGGGEKTYKPWTPAELEACYEYWELFMVKRYPSRTESMQALAYAIDGMVEISSMACKPSDFAARPTTRPQGEPSMEAPPPREDLPTTEQGIDDSQIPF